MTDPIAPRLNGFDAVLFDLDGVITETRTDDMWLIASSGSVCARRAP